jgi:hypothetical protein
LRWWPVVSLLFYLLYIRHLLYYCTAQPFPSQLAELLTCLVKVELESRETESGWWKCKIPHFQNGNFKSYLFWRAFFKKFHLILKFKFDPTDVV